MKSGETRKGCTGLPLRAPSVDVELAAPAKLWSPTNLEYSRLLAVGQAIYWRPDDFDGHLAVIRAGSGPLFARFLDDLSALWHEEWRSDADRRQTFVRISERLLDRSDVVGRLAANAFLAASLLRS
jgi:hypothetical protein